MALHDLTYAEIGDVLGVTRQRAQQLVQAYGGRDKAPHDPFALLLTPARRRIAYRMNSVLDLHRKGLRSSEIARVLGVTCPTVHMDRAALGLAPVRKRANGTCAHCQAPTIDGLYAKIARKRSTGSP